MHQIVFLDRGTITVPFRKPSITHEWMDYERTSPAEVIDRLRMATIVVTNKVQIREQALSALSHLKYITITATGYDNVDLAVCKKRGIQVSNVPAYSRDSVPEHVFMMMLALRRNLIAYWELVRAERWQMSANAALNVLPIEDLRGSTLGLIGYGDLARQVESLAKAFGMEVLIAERKGAKSIRTGRRAFEEVLKKSDIVSLHAPLTDQTRKMIGSAELALMKPTAVLINTARGSLVDEAALAAALSTGRLGGAGIDVLSNEPPHEGNPLLNLHLPNLIVTPHVAWTSRQAQELLAEEVVKNIEAFASGKPRNLVS